MKYVKKEAAFIAITALCMTLAGHAQNNIPKYEFGVNLGFLLYQGDLTPEKLGAFKTQKITLGLHASHILGPSFSLRTNLAFGKLKGDDSKYNTPEFRQQRNFNFTSPVLEVSELLVWNAAAKNYADKGFSPYLFAGAGLSFLKIKPDWSNINTSYFPVESAEIWTGLAADAVHKLPGIIPVIPVGAGIKYFITPEWAVNAEASYRVAFTDYMDGFSQAANPTKKDHYSIYSAGLIYRTGKKNKLGCPVMKY